MFRRNIANQVFLAQILNAGERNRGQFWLSRQKVIEMNIVDQEKKQIQTFGTEYISIFTHG